MTEGENMNRRRRPDLRGGATCPLPISEYPNIQMAHGGGGKLTAELIDKVFLSAFDNPYLNARHDGAVFDIGGVRLAMSTDSYVVKPLFFPGGDIGKLAVCGTVNDLSMCGARPAYLSAGFIIEEGFSMEELCRIAQSMRRAADEAGVSLVTGDTKVVDKGKGDGVYINTAGVGEVPGTRHVGPAHVRDGDVLILNGDIGRHGMSIMSAREGVTFESSIQSDCAPLNGVVESLFQAGVDVHCMRDLTRGGLATAAVEIAEDSGLGIELEERDMPVRDDVRSACEILGFDPLYVANEGRMLVFVSPGDAEKALKIMRESEYGDGPRIIGRCASSGANNVRLKNVYGTSRIIDRLSGEQLPRIC